MKLSQTGRKNTLKILIGIIARGIVGFLYYRFIGCTSSACKMASNPFISTIYWAFLGGFLACAH